MEEKQMTVYRLGYYGASKEVAEQLDPDGYKVDICEDTRLDIFEAIANDYPDIHEMSDSDKKAVAKWVVNELL